MLDLLNLPGIKPVDMYKESKALIIVAVPEEVEVPLCEACKTPMHKHGTRKNRFSDTPLYMEPVRLEIQRPRFRCESCGKMAMPELNFLDDKRRSTKRLVDVIRQQCLSTTFRALAEQTGVAVNTVKNVAHDLIEELEQTVRYETPVIMGIDEVNLAGGYRCVITNLATNNVFDMLEHRTQDHLKPFFKDLTDRDKVEWVCTDMWRPFKRSFAQYLPNAKLVIDKFHVVKMASEALEDERKKYQVQLGKNERINVKKSIRWLTLKRPQNLTPAEQKALIIVREQIPELAIAYDFKESFFAIYDELDKQQAQNAFEAWENSLPDQGMESFKKLVKTVHNHYDDIFAYWDAPFPITNAYTEGLNGLIKMSNRLGRGYSYEIIRAKTLYSAEARKVGSGIRSGRGKVEYGPHIPTLLKQAESGELD
ncbi:MULTISPECIES: ISL3 family transposase [unclassified Methylophaga]|jgi:transposase|uniref:ISL3 family transposase n=1 Tax=unclassified Methylophaga TaxID=2629249 RepID=UPI000C8FA7BA|nr:MULTISPECIES: ISL3 family transposase [unclassified Methylophaga]MAP28197.1 ISL3 family transposase [Methylophaga sp.]MTI63082.1 ISL3 family transposase [Methylophaga sp.]HAD30377.1 ISL3 family transposase [Methylophaga sp.]HCN98861.1 ISL3 family transposase [Methylophaga sp.]|tara:strand:- start:2210 stop:3478 length:1269 start_codon:yes stop_codon:yes gene_type:complete